MSLGSVPALSEFTLSETMLGRLLGLKEHPHEYQEPRFRTITLHCSHDQCHSLDLRVVSLSILKQMDTQGQHIKTGVAAFSSIQRVLIVWLLFSTGPRQDRAGTGM